VEQIRDALRQVRGAFSLVLMTDTALIAARDHAGFRPLAIGRKGEAFLVASETVAFDIVDAEYLRDVAPGEIVVIDRRAQESGQVASLPISDAPPAPHHCIFEYIYFSRPDSQISSAAPSAAATTATQAATNEPTSMPPRVLRIRSTTR